MQCPSCGGADLVRDVRDVTYTYKGRTITIPQLAGLYCPACDEAIFDAGEDERFQAAAARLVRQVNCQALPNIRRIRKKLKLTQREAGEIFGGGVNAFSRYERGETEPPVAVVKLLRLLDKHPELLKEVWREEA